MITVRDHGTDDDAKCGEAPGGYGVASRWRFLSCVPDRDQMKMRLNERDDVVNEAVRKRNIGAATREGSELK